MQAKDAIRTALKSTQHFVNWYLSDLSDADLLVRPTPGANHIAWQLGHLVVAESMFVTKMPGLDLSGARYPDLPPGFAEQHAKDKAAQDPPTGFATKAQYLGLFNQARQATLAALDKVSDADLDRPTEGRMATFAPNLGALFLLTSNHSLMHTGQFSVVRRKLGKPVLF